MRMGARTLTVCAVVCLQAAVAAAQGRTMNLVMVSGACARTGAADRQCEAGNRGNARPSRPERRCDSSPIPNFRERWGTATGRSRALHRLRGRRRRRRSNQASATFGSDGRRSRSDRAINRRARGHDATCDACRRRELLSRASRRGPHRCRLVRANWRRLLHRGRPPLRAGDIAVLDVNLARAALARVSADRDAAGATRVEALGELEELLGIDEGGGGEGKSGGANDADLNSGAGLGFQRPELSALEAGAGS